MDKREQDGPGLLGGFSDLIGIVLLTAVSLLAVQTLTGPVRVVLGFVFLFVLPGYAITAALYPRMERQSTGQDGWSQPLETVPTATEWAVLTVGLSIAAVPLALLVVNFLPIAIREQTALGAVSLLILASTFAAVVRRGRVPPHERTYVPYGRVLDTIGHHLSGGPSVAAVVVACGLLTAGLAGATIVTQQPGEQFTEFYLLTQEDGEAVADDYPTELGPDGEVTVTLGLTNQEHETVSYSVLVQAHRVEETNGEPEVVGGEQLGQLNTTVAHNETWQRQLVVSPRVISDELRLTFLLYKGSPPEYPTTDNAYRSVHIWTSAEQ